MNEIASRGQLRAGFLRWAIVTVPLILLLGIGIGTLVPAGSENAWYQALRMPAIVPPDWAFPVAWTTIYVLMGIAVALVLNARGARGRGVALVLFVLQLIVNLAWTPLFFGLHQVTAALWVIAGMFVLAVATTIAFGRIRSVAAWCLVPYLAWLVVAAALNWQIDRLNPEAETLVVQGASTQITL